MLIDAHPPLVGWGGGGGGGAAVALPYRSLLTKRN